MEEKQDKYEQLLAKVDWHAPHPPKGYQYGVGRGAKGFVTTAELTTGASTTAKMSRDESDFFSAMERLEERAGKTTRRDEADGAVGPRAALVGSSGGASAAPAKPKLSLEDLASLEAIPPARAAIPVAASPASATGQVEARAHASSNTTAMNPAAAASPAAPAPASSGAPLVVRSARTEEGEAAEEHVFAEERVLTAYDVLKGKVSAVQAGLHNVLAMGSTEEQTTWITHARAYREMGMTRRAYQTLVEGCAVTGRKGKRIWEERLRYLSTDNLAGRCRLLEEATAACPAEEELWTQLLDCVLPLERVPCLQRAVLACPTSEQLWLRLVHFVPSAQDQRSLLQKALQYTPTLPLLWARLARLETYQTGKEMFHAAAARYPSLALIIEAAKYVEWHALAHYWAARSPTTAGATATPVASAEEDTEEVGASPMASVYAAVRLADSEVRGLVRTAQRNYLDLGEAGSRQAWLSLALSLLQDAASETAKDALAEAATPTAAAAAAVAPEGPAAPAANVYVCTAAHMLLCVVQPDEKRGAAGTVSATWLEDLIALLPAGAATSRHSVQCALWYTWLLAQQLASGVERSQGRVDAAAGAASRASAAVGAASRDILPVLAAAVLSAPAAVLREHLPRMLRGSDAAARDVVSPRGAAERVGSGAERTGVDTKSLAANNGGLDAEEEEEEEELARPQPGKVAAAAPLSSHTVSPVVGSAGDVRHDKTTSASSDLPLPPALVVVLASLLGIVTRIAGSAASAAAAADASTTPGVQPDTAAARSAADASSPPPAQDLLLVEMPLAVSHALYQRGSFAAALSLIDRLLPSEAFSPPPVLPSAPSQPQSASADLRLYVARAKMLAAVGDCAAADACLLRAIAVAAAADLAHDASAAAGATAVEAHQQAQARLQREEEAWVKLAVLRRSLGRPIDTVVADGVQRCPRSPRLWLMLLEEKRRAIQARQAQLAASAPPGSAASIAGLLRQDETLAGEVRELRVLCKRALSPEHCRAVASVWVFAAARVEAELLRNVAAARALVTDALAACAAQLHSTRAHYLASRQATPQEMERQARAAARLGVTQAALDVQYGTPGQALETVQEVLQRLPKTRDGAFAMPQDDALGELLALFISLEPPASRGRAAAQVMRQWKSREPLALCAVAQLYFAAGQYARALDQAKKAVQLSRGRCGDAVALLWRLAEAPAMQPFVREEVMGRKGDGEDSGEGKTAGAPQTDGSTAGELSPEVIQRWVLSFLRPASTVAEGEGAETLVGSSATAVTADSVVVCPNSGPLWIAVAKAEDPSNVTLLGLRRSVPDMLREVASRIVLKGPDAQPTAQGRS